MIWSVLGISVAVVALFCISVAETLVGQPLFEAYRPHLALALAFAGGAAWLLGRYIASRDAEVQTRRYLLADLRYWGPMLLVLGIITIFIRPLRAIEERRPVVAVARPAPQKQVVSPAPQVEKPLPAKAAVFPVVKMQGIIFRQPQPFVILDGESYAAGDYVGEAVVLAINRDHVLLGIAGETKVLSMK